MDRFKCPHKENILCPGRSPLTACKGCGDNILKEGEVIMTDSQNVSNVMTFTQKGGITVFCKCYCWKVCYEAPEGETCEEAIPHFSTVEEAHTAGWVQTNHPKFCPPKEPAQWVCPNCSKDFNWELETRRVHRAYDGRTLRFHNRR